MADEQPQLHDLTKFLLSRLESFPEEFGIQRGKWEKIIQYANQFLPKEEKDLLNRTLKEHYLNVALQEAMRILLAEQKAPPKQVGVNHAISKKDIENAWLATLNQELAKAYDASGNQTLGAILREWMEP